MEATIYEMKLLVEADSMTPFPDVFIFAGGSDKRAYESLRLLSAKSLLPQTQLMFEFQERLAGVKPKDEYFDYSNVLPHAPIKIQCSLSLPDSSLPDLTKHSHLFEHASIGLDISCFSKPYFFYILRYLKSQLEVAELKVFYTEPMSYLFPGGLATSYRSSLGPLKVLEMPGYAGAESRGQKRTLVLLLGFDGDISREIGEDVSPNEMIAVNGFPGYMPKFKDISLILNEKLIGMEGVHLKYGPANNPFEIYNLLSKIHDDTADTFLNIAPIGTKPMALGACLFALHHPATRVVYPFPRSYEKVTTEYCWNTWFYTVSL
ncbi:MAG: hypothetical protein WBD36_02985 [Bacteroidota bacterium]